MWVIFYRKDSLEAAHSVSEWKISVPLPQMHIWGEHSRTFRIAYFLNTGIQGALMRWKLTNPWCFRTRTRSSEHHYTQTLRARELNFWENVHLQQRVTCQVSQVKCQVSGVTFFLTTLWLCGKSFINGAFPVQFQQNWDTFKDNRKRSIIQNIFYLPGGNMMHLETNQTQFRTP